MTMTWNDSVPIYRQLQQRVVAMILDGALNEGDPLPSVRQVAADYQINPLTVSKAYQELVDQQLVEKRRGLGMFVIEGARAALLTSERERFLHEEWPLLFARLQRLGLDLKTLLREAQTEKDLAAGNQANKEKQS
jgi:GntR family transcriptional regulator